MHGARLAQTGDSSLLSRLLEEAKAATPMRRGVALFGQPSRSTASADRVQRAMVDDNSVLVAGCIDEVVVGIALAHLDDASLTSIEELYVEPEAREVGVGEAMLDFIV